MSKSEKTVKFTNCRLIRYNRIVTDDLWVRNGRIINPEPVFYEEKIRADFVVDCHGLIVAPGLIDIQVNGGFGIDFSSDVAEIGNAISVFRKKVTSTGVTSFCPTIVTSPCLVYHQITRQVKKSVGSNEIGATILGLHLEGPFINREKKGAHPEQFIRKFDERPENLKSVYGDLSNVCLVTIAPELNQSTQVIKFLTRNGIVVSLGHSTANLTVGEKAVNDGATFITHLFNAMLTFHHRDPGLVGLLTSEKIKRPAFYGIIADGIHTHPAALRIAYKTDPQGLVLVTDAVAALGLGDGCHQIGQLQVEVKGRKAYLKDTETLAGSIATMQDCVRGLMKSAQADLVQAVQSATLHPAQVLGIENKKGTLNFGADADFILISEDPFTVKHTFIAGECAFSEDGVKKITFKVGN